MTLPHFNYDSISSSSILLVSGKCDACWKCLEACPNEVFGKIDLPWHKHVIIAKNSNCTGCKQCLSICKNGALTESNSLTLEAMKNIKKLSFSFNVNIILFAAAMVSILSGLLVQVNYHMGNHGSIDTTVKTMCLDYFGWSLVHKAGTIILSILVGIHIAMHWKWYKNVISKNLISKNRQVIVLSVVFILVALTGYISWAIDIFSNDQTVRKLFIEIHDKLTLVFLIYLILHIIKRFKWYVNTYNRIKNNFS